MRRPRNGLLVVAGGVLAVGVVVVGVVVGAVVGVGVVLDGLVVVAAAPVFVAPGVLVVLVVLVVPEVLEPEATVVTGLDVVLLLDVRAVTPAFASVAIGTIGATVVLLPVAGALGVAPVALLDAPLAAVSPLSALDVVEFAAAVPGAAAVASLSPDPQAARLAAKIVQNSARLIFVVRYVMAGRLLIRVAMPTEIMSVETARELRVSAP